MAHVLTAPALSMANVRQRIVGIDQQVPVLDGSLRPYINFDNAASTPALRDVLDTVNQFMDWYSSVHRGTGFKSRVATQAYDDAREIVGDFVGANEQDHVVIFGKNTSEAVNKLAFRFPLNADDVVLVSLLEHHSNDLPWRARAHVEHVRADEHGALDEDHLDELLEQFAGRVKLAAITGAANVTGHLPDIHGIAERVHAAGAMIMVDCAQLAPHRQVRMRPLSDPGHLDFVAISAHKMYAPFGTGALIGRRDVFDSGEPEYRGGGTIDFVTLNEVAWAAAPERDEVGSPNVVGAVALAASIQALEQIGMDAIAAHEAEITEYTLSQLSAIPEVTVYGDSNPMQATGRVGAIPINVEGMSHFLVAAILGTEFGIGVRNGCFCAHPYMLHLLGLKETEATRVRDDIAAENRADMPGLVRISFGMYNTNEEVDVLTDALRDIAGGAYSGDYVQDTHSGEYHARNWNPNLEPYFKL